MAYLPAPHDNRPSSEDLMFAFLSVLVLLATAFTVGGLAAHPFSV